MTIKSILLAFALAFLAESMTEFLLNTVLRATVKKHPWIAELEPMKYAALCVGVLMALMYNVDLILEAFGQVARVPWFGVVLTGLAIGRGSNYIHDFLEALPATTAGGTAKRGSGERTRATGGVHVVNEPNPNIFVMIDYANIDPPAAWGPVGSWYYLGWREALGFSKFDAYLEKASALGKPVALSIMLLGQLGEDSTPYERINVITEGWAENGITYPRWNDPYWDNAYRALIMALGAKYDKDDRVHSWWICTGIAGETRFDKIGGHNPRRFVENAMRWHKEAFPTKQLYVISTGNPDRKHYSELAIELGIGVKHNSLHYDLPNEIGLGQYAGNGLWETEALAYGKVPVGFEHYYNGLSEPITYWSMLRGLVMGMSVLDMPIKGGHLDTLAKMTTPEYGKLWDWVLGMMRQPLDQVAMWIARDTATISDGYNAGYPGPWIRGGIAINAAAYAPGSPEYKAAPAALTSHLYGYGGIGYSDAPTVTLSGLPVGWYDVACIYAPGGTQSWRQDVITVQVDGTVTLPVATAPAWLHSIIVTPSTEAPEPPPVEPPPATELEAMRKELATARDRLTAMDAAMSAKFAQLGAMQDQLDAIDADQAQHETRMADIEADAKQERADNAARWQALRDALD